jgi:hypothetical protein
MTTQTPIAPPKPEELVDDDNVAVYGDASASEEAPKDKAEPKPEPDVPVEPALTSIQRLLNSGKARSTMFVENQEQRYPHTIIYKGSETLMYDLSDEDQLKAYNDVKSKALDPHFGLTIVWQDIKFSEKSDCWKALLEVSHYLYISPTESSDV